MSMPSSAPAYAPAAPAPAPSPGGLGFLGARSGRGGAADAMTKAEEPERKAPVAAREQANGDARAVLHVEIERERAEAMADTTALRAAVRKALERAASACLAAGRYELRLVVDGGGKVIRVELLASPDVASRRCAERTLTGLAVGSRPNAGGNGVWTATVRIVR
jgi:hypothetical protein